MFLDNHNGRYIIDKDHKVSPCPDLHDWAKFMEQWDLRRVALTELPWDGKPIRVSTVFLGLDHNFGSGGPILFETMIFGGPHDNYQERYHTWEEAEAGHKRACEMATTIMPEGE